jgi:hypothetical protein
MEIANAIVVTANATATAPNANQADLSSRNILGEIF